MQEQACLVCYASTRVVEAFFCRDLRMEVKEMIKTSIIGYPRIGKKRELKFAVEDYLEGKISQNQLENKARALRQEHWQLQSEAGIDFIPSGDFSLYDQVLDTAFMLSAIPREFYDLELSPLDTYFAMAKGYQGEGGDVKALPMKKWFNTNYHYLTPTLTRDMDFKLNQPQVLSHWQEGKKLCIQTKPLLLGPFTFLKLAKLQGEWKYYAEAIVPLYAELIAKLGQMGAAWLQLDEPMLVTDLTEADNAAFRSIYQQILSQKGPVKVLLQTYFGDVRDIYQDLLSLDFDALGLDFVDGEKSLELLASYGFPEDKLLFAGVIAGKNIWRCDYQGKLSLLDKIATQLEKERVILSTSCSLLHVPYSLEAETWEEADITQLAFAQEKLTELGELAQLWQCPGYKTQSSFISNQKIHKLRQTVGACRGEGQVQKLTESDFTRKPDFQKREQLQRPALKLPLLPTTTIGSFPQSGEVRKLRRSFKNGQLTEKQYQDEIRAMIREVISLQEELGLDVLVHGEFERNDMVEYFGENLAGFIFSQNGWVQSYGTRCVKPPIIFGDVAWVRPITVAYLTYAQSLTDKPVKGMLTGPVTILNWSFAREDLSSEKIAYQLALAIREEVMKLESSGIKIIQIDEAALREKLPLRKLEWEEYLKWTIRAFRLTHSGVKPTTQIHTHMCYSEFDDILQEIENMDADVITFEAAKSELTLLSSLAKTNFKTQVGPGVYDIHSPRIPSTEEISEVLSKMLKLLPKEKLWVNPDCGLKTRKAEEVIPSLKNIVRAAEKMRTEIEL